MNTHITIHERLQRHERDVALLGRLFADWSRGREQRNAEAHQRLDAIEIQLARLERSVGTMESSPRNAASSSRRLGPSRIRSSLSVQQS